MFIKIKRYLYVIIGLLIVSIAFNVFLMPYGIAAGGISGLAMVFNNLYNVDISLFVLISNIILVLLSFLTLGKRVTLKTIIGALLSPLFLKITLPLAKFIDISGVETIVVAIFGGVLSGLGYGLVFKEGFTSGGTDILNQIISKYYKKPIGTSIILVDGFIVLLAGVVFGIEKMIYAIIVLLLISLYSNKAIIGMGTNKSFYIYTSKSKEVTDYLINGVKNDVTLLEGEGGYSNKKINVIMSVINTSDYYKVKKGISEIDENAFIIVNESYELVNGNKTLNLG